ncbi:MAG TPA: energy transducer TonB [Balneolaceae bacterium]|nr:energy transducer TonB [Balneolaceae bacterium]
MEVTIKKSIHSLKTAVIILLAVGLAALFSAGETKAQDASEVFTVVDEMPEMIGGMESLYGEIKYPRAAVQAGIEGRVFIQFVVDKDGNVRDEKVLRDIGGGCGEAALEAVRGVNFSPGKKNGVAVNVQYSMPVTFKLQKG